jgi:hypothetical protein
MALKAGDTILTGPGEQPPSVPAGFRWVITKILASDSGGGTVWTLEESDPGAGEWVTDLQSQFSAGILAFLQSLGAAAGVRGGLGRTRPLCFTNYTQVLTPMKWTADRDYNFIGAWCPGGWEIVISIFPLVNPIGTDVVPTVRDGVLVATTATTPGMIGNVPAIPIVKGTTLYIWFKSQLGVVVVYLEDAS